MDLLHRLIHLKRVGPLLILMLGSVSATGTQDIPKKLEWSDQARVTCGKVGESALANYAIELEDIRIDGRSIFIGEPFAGDFRNLVFVVKNISDRPINFIQITLVLPEVNPSPPQIPFVRTAPDSKSKPVLPGEQTELHVPAGKVYDWVKDTVASQGMDLQNLRRAAMYSFTVEKPGSPAGECIKMRDPRNVCPPL